MLRNVDLLFLGIILTAIGRTGDDLLSTVIGCVSLAAYVVAEWRNRPRRTRRDAGTDERHADSHPVTRP